MSQPVQVCAVRYYQDPKALARRSDCRPPLYVEFPTVFGSSDTAPLLGVSGTSHTVHCADNNGRAVHTETRVAIVSPLFLSDASELNLH